MQDTINFGIYANLEWDKLSTEYLHGLADMGNIEAQEELDNRYNAPIQTQKIGFGKYSGCMWVELDTDYLYWLINNVDTSTIKFKLANKALEYIKEHNISDEFIDVIYVD